RHTAEGRLEWRERVSREEIADLLSFHDVRGWASVLGNWAIVLAAMALVARWPNPATVVLALFAIGARPLGFAVLMHEAAHRSLFASRGMNDGVGQWLCASPVWSDLLAYRPYHLQHHAHTATARDPDLGLVAPFPITRASLRRKIGRDLSGRTGLKFARASWR